MEKSVTTMPERAESVFSAEAGIDRDAGLLVMNQLAKIFRTAGAAIPFPASAQVGDAQPDETEPGVDDERRAWRTPKCPEPVVQRIEQTFDSRCG